MRRQDSERRHRIDREGLRDGRSERLSKEGDSSFRFTATREELALEALVTLADEEGRSLQASSTAGASLDLVVEQLLHMVNRQQVFTVHGNDDGVPDLRDQDLIQSQY